MAACKIKMDINILYALAVIIVRFFGKIKIQ